MCNFRSLVQLLIQNVTEIYSLPFQSNMSLMFVQISGKTVPVPLSIPISHTACKLCGYLRIFQQRNMTLIGNFQCAYEVSTYLGSNGVISSWQTLLKTQFTSVDYFQTFTLLMTSCHGSYLVFIPLGQWDILIYYWCIIAHFIFIR